MNKLPMKIANFSQKFRISLLIILISFLCIQLSIARAYASESTIASTLSSVVANGSSATIITFKVSEGGEGVAGKSVFFTASGELNVLSPWDGQRPDDGTSITALTDANGDAIIQFRSAKEGVKQVTAVVEGDESLTKILTITFTSPVNGYQPPFHISNPVTPPSEEPANNSGTSSNEPTAQYDQEVPEIPSINYIIYNGQNIRPEDLTSTKVNESFEIIGNTVSNGNVTMYIYSEPKTASVTADDKGEWRYTVDCLTPGNHHIEAEVTDPKTNKASQRGTLLTFNTEDKITSCPSSAGFWSSWNKLIIAFIATILLLSLFIVRKRMNKKKSKKF